MISRSKKYRKSMEGFSQDETSTLSDAFGRLENLKK